MIQFCISSCSFNFVKIGNPFLMFPIHAFICLRNRYGVATMNDFAKILLIANFCLYFINQKMFIWLPGDIAY